MVVWRTFVVTLGLVSLWDLTKGAKCPAGQEPAKFGADMKLTKWTKSVDKSDAMKAFLARRNLNVGVTATFTIVPNQGVSLTLMDLRVEASQGKSLTAEVQNPLLVKYKADFEGELAKLDLPKKGIPQISSVKILVRPEKGASLKVRMVDILLCKGINECEREPCVHGKCRDLNVGFKCKCEAGWTGKKCDVNIDDCRPNPCQNRGKCKDRVNGYKCSCREGFTGVNCETNIDDCKGNKCREGSCVDQVNGYKCSCDEGWQGKYCGRNIDDCASNPCRNGGTCVDGIASFKCKCPSGWGGGKCGYNIDECASKPCVRGVCKDRINGYTCTCDPGWQGNNCHKNINECASNPCGENGVCSDRDNDYSCFCNNGWAGKNCTIAVVYDKRCPRNFMRLDLMSEHSKFFNLRISPNGYDQDPRWGLLHSKFENDQTAYLKLSRGDTYTVRMGNLPGGSLYVGKLCLATFVVDEVQVTYRQTDNPYPIIFKMEPLMGENWFRDACTSDFDKFIKVDSIEIKYYHQPPNFNMKNLQIEACVPLGII